MPGGGLNARQLGCLIGALMIFLCGILLITGVTYELGLTQDEKFAKEPPAGRIALYSFWSLLIWVGLRLCGFRPEQGIWSKIRYYLDIICGFVFGAFFIGGAVSLVILFVYILMTGNPDPESLPDPPLLMIIPMIVSFILGGVLGVIICHRKLK
jgi:hypothetical protein